MKIDLMRSSGVFELACADLLEELSQDPVLQKHAIGEDEQINILTETCKLGQELLFYSSLLEMIQFFDIILLILRMKVIDPINHWKGNVL